MKVVVNTPITYRTFKPVERLAPVIPHLICILNGDDVHTSRIELIKLVTSLTLPRNNALLGNGSHHFTGVKV